VTLKLQEEEEEHLLAQFVLPPLAVNYCNFFSDTTLPALLTPSFSFCTPPRPSLNMGPRRACSTTVNVLRRYALIKLRMVPGKCIIFVNSIETCYQVPPTATSHRRFVFSASARCRLRRVTPFGAQVKLFLDQFSIRSAVLNAELPRNSRLHTVREFNRGHVEYIIATDEALKAVATAADSAPAADDDGDGEDTGSGKKQKGKKNITKDKECAQLHSPCIAPFADSSSFFFSPFSSSFSASFYRYGVARGVDFQVCTRCAMCRLPLLDAVGWRPIHTVGRAPTPSSTSSCQVMR
jgi:superfamily II DNA/RNA helicase